MSEQFCLCCNQEEPNVIDYTNVGFEHVLNSFRNSMQEGKVKIKARCLGWGHKAWVKLQEPDADSKMRNPYLYMEFDDNKTTFPWTPCTLELLHHNWEVCHA